MDAGTEVCEWGDYLKRDKKLRMAILPMFGLIFFYYFLPFMSKHSGFDFGDLFTVTRLQDVFANSMFYFLVPVFIASAIALIRYSTDWQASWIYYTSPISPTKLYTGAYLAMTTWIILPMWIITTVLFSWKMPVHHALLQTLVIFVLADYYGVLGHLMLPHLPLSAPFAQQGRQARLIFIMLFGVIVSLVILVIEYFAFKYILGTIIFFIFLLGLATLLHFLESLRINHNYRKFEFVE